MDMTVYPDFDVDAELDRAQSHVDYHKAQVRYYESQVAHLKRARAEKQELQRMYGDREVAYDDAEIDVSYLNDGSAADYEVAYGDERDAQFYEVGANGEMVASSEEEVADDLDQDETEYLTEVDYARHMDEPAPDPSYV